jgi:Arf-GAP/coiled-coil/ANK repeat/PH domain-containing protein
VRDYKHHFEKISSEFDSVLVRNSQTPRSKAQEVEEMQNVLLAVRSCFGHQALDYVNSISLLQTKKRHEILSTLLSYMHACTTYYHQGSDLCADLEPFFKTLADEVIVARDLDSFIDLLVCRSATCAKTPVWSRKSWRTGTRRSTASR